MDRHIPTGHFSNERQRLSGDGVLGGFTTFSSFSLDTLALIRDGHPDQAAFNVAGQVGLSPGGVWAGYRLAHW